MAEAAGARVIREARRGCGSALAHGLLIVGGSRASFGVVSRSPFPRREENEVGQRATIG